MGNSGQLTSSHNGEVFDVKSNIPGKMNTKINKEQEVIFQPKSPNNIRIEDKINSLNLSQHFDGTELAVSKIFYF